MTKDTCSIIKDCYCVLKKTINMYTSDWCDAEGSSAGSLGKSGIFKVVCMVQSQDWDVVGCRGAVRLLLSKPEYNDTELSKAPKCSGMTGSGQGCSLFSIIAASVGRSTLSTACSAGHSLFSTVALIGLYLRT